MAIRTTGGKVITKNGKVSCECCQNISCNSILFSTPELEQLSNNLKNSTTGLLYGRPPDSVEFSGPPDQRTGWAMQWLPYRPEENLPYVEWLGGATYDFNSKLFSMFVTGIDNSIESWADRAGCIFQCRENFDLFGCPKTNFFINGTQFPAYRRQSLPESFNPPIPNFIFS